MYLLTNAIDYNKFSPTYAAFLSTITRVCEPQTFQDTNIHVEWRKAMADELQALYENHNMDGCQAFQG